MAKVTMQIQLAHLMDMFDESEKKIKEMYGEQLTNLKNQRDAAIRELWEQNIDSGLLKSELDN